MGGSVELTVPGDKSISQRALILAALGTGKSRIRGLLPGGDPLSTAGALRALGVPIPPVGEWGVEVRVPGMGLRGLRAPAMPLDLQNSGTGARLLLGVLAGEPLRAVVTGDDSLRKRPMGRVTEPLSRMGGAFRALEEEDRLPLEVRGGPLRSLDHNLPVASAQVKSSLLLAGLVGQVEVRLTEPGRSRDHTERMLGELGVRVRSELVEGGWMVALEDPPPALPPLDLEVPGDFSSAAFLLVLGLLGGAGRGLVIRNVGLNGTRTGLLPVLERMGARIAVRGETGPERGEPRGDLEVEASELAGCEIGTAEVPGLIDEVPVLAVAAARARGLTRITGARELRVKETDRIRAVVENLRALGVGAQELGDGMEIEGTDRPLSGRVQSFGDHRIAMAFGVLGALPGNRIEVEAPEVVGVSFPGFWALLGEARRIRRAGLGSREGGGSPGPSHGSFRTDRPRGSGRPPVITLDGPAGSGKSSTARAVARRLGYRHLDSGALYRALTFALLSAGVPESEWPDLSLQELDRFLIELKPVEGRFLVMLGDRALEEELRTPEVTARVSPLSALPAVRAWLLEAQRRAGREGGLVADGRDMGTVVFPDAEVKVFLTAALPERARRRYLEREGRPPRPDELSDESARIEERDVRDAGRTVAPLRKPTGALEVDTSNLPFESQVEIILRQVGTLTGE